MVWRCVRAGAALVLLAACHEPSPTEAPPPLPPPSPDAAAPEVDAGMSSVPDAVANDAPTPAEAEAAAPPTFRDRCVPATAPAPPAPLRTFYVDADAGDDTRDGTSTATAWKTLSKANASASPGDLFLVKGAFDGQYIRPATSGTKDRMIVFRALPGAPQPTIRNAQYGTAALLAGMDYVVVDGFEITANGDPASMSNGAWLRNCKIHDNAGYIRIIGVNDARVEDNDIANCGDYCFWTSDGATNNQVLRNAIGTSNSTSFMLSAPGNTIGFNDFANTLQTNLALNGGSDGTTVECNTFRDAGTKAAPGYYTPSALISSNKNVVRFNLAYGNALEGISIWIEGNDNAFYHNVVWGNGGPDMRLLVDQQGKEIMNNSFQNNIFWNNNTSSDSHWNYQGTKGKIVVDTYHVQTNGWTDGSFGGNRFGNNLLGATPDEAGKGWLLMIGYTKNAVYTLASAENAWPASLLGNFEGDPLFEDPARGVFHLTAASPCIDKGVVIPGLDYAGAAPDLGRFEYVGPR